MLKKSNPVGSGCDSNSSKPISPGNCAPSDVAELDPKTRQLSPPVVQGTAVQPVLLPMVNDRLVTPAAIAFETSSWIQFVPCSSCSDTPPLWVGSSFRPSPTSPAPSL